MVTRLTRRLPSFALLGCAALLETARINSGWTVVDEFASRYVYFLTGYLFASEVFVLASWAGRRTGSALAILLVWVLIETGFVFSPSPFAGYANLASLPVVSLALGLAGAAAVIVIASLFARVDWAVWLRYCGRNSLVVYLAFFLPMAVSRTTFVRLGFVDHVGLVSGLITICGISVPLVMHAMVRGTWLSFLFERPDCCRLTRAPPMERLQAAE